MRHLSSLIPPELLLQAYARGYFPMADSRNGSISWYTADPRAILPLHPCHIPRRLRRTLKHAPYRCTRDQAFERVIEGCADRSSTWISDALIRSYVELHQRGAAHSVEVWRGEELVGGLYGVRLGAAFFGESTFGREPDTAKVAMAHLLHHLESRDFRLLEIQMITNLTAQFGARTVTRAEYLPLLREALALEREW